MGLIDMLLNILDTAQEFIGEKQNELYKEMSINDRKKDADLIREYKELSRSSGNNIRKSALRLSLKDRGYADKDN